MYVKETNLVIEKISVKMIFMKALYNIDCLDVQC